MKNKVACFFKRLDYENLAMRLIAAWCIVSSLSVILSDVPFSEISFMGTLNAAVFVIVVALFFALIFIADKILDRNFNFKKTDGVCFFLSVLFYAILLLFENPSIYFYVAILAVVSFCGYYVLKRDKLPIVNIRFSKKSVIIILSVIFSLFVVFIGGLTVLRYLTYSSPCFDFGIFSQMFYYMKETFLPYVTCERDMFLSHFAVHFSPIYYLLLPFYLIFPSPITLQVGQAVVLGLGIIPLYLLAKHFRLSEKTALLLCVVYILYPALGGGCFYDLHENKFLTVFILFLFYFLEKQKFVPVYIFALLVMLVKEDAAIYIFCIALYMIISRKQFKHGTILMIASAIYFVVVLTLMEKYGLGVMTNRFNNMIYGEYTGLVGVIRTALLNPGYVFSQSFNEEKFVFILQMLLPLGFMPFISKRISQLILIIPFFIINLIPNYVYQHSILFQYTYAVTGIFFFLTVKNLSEFKPQPKRFVSAFLVVATLLLFVCTVYPKKYYVSIYFNGRQVYQAVDECLESIPEDASVTASSFLVPKLSKRKILYQYPSENTTEFIVLDLRYGEFSEDEINAFLYSGYEIYTKIDNVLLVMQMVD